MLSNASLTWSNVALIPGSVSILMAWPPAHSICCAKRVLNSPFTGIITLSSFLIKLTTAHSVVPVPDADKQTGYPYGTLLECVGTTYKKSVGTGTTLERGIQYNVQKTSSKGTNAVMGAYANRYSTFLVCLINYYL